MKTIQNKLISVVLFISVFFQVANAQFFLSKAYPTGNYIFCGKELPKNFSYLIEKKTGANQWKAVTELKAPVSEAECKANLMNLPASIASITRIETGLIQFLWKRIQKSLVIDSLFAYSTDPRFQYVAGSGWFDEGIREPGEYQYKINKLSKNGSKTLVNEVTVSFPSKPLNATVSPVRFKMYENSIDLSYEISDPANTFGVKLYRSGYLQKNFSEIPADMMFTKQKDKMVALLSDENVTKGLTYSYVAIPYDGLGNKGKASDTLNIYFVAKAADIGLVTGFEVIPNPEKAGNLLRWKYNYKMNVTTIEVFRSETYEGNYKHIASLGQKQTEYLDKLNLKPATTYFYYLTINDGIGNSLPSARVPAILEGKKKNFLPPQELTASRNGNVVTLQFCRLGKDIRGYYVYRGDGYIAPLSQLPRMLLSTDSVLTYNDTLSQSVTPSVYSYAVASINTSYNISPLSSRVNISYSGGKLPVPDKLNAMVRNDEIMLTWSDVANQNSAITGYRIYRKTVSKNVVEEPEHIIATTGFMNNTFMDQSVTAGRYYTYRVQSVGADSLDTSSVSQPYSVLFGNQPLLQPGNVSAIPAGDKIILKWTLPDDPDLTAVMIYRSVKNGEPVLIKETDNKVESFEDNTALKNTMYFYFIVLKYKNNLTSTPTDAVGGKW